MLSLGGPQEGGEAPPGVQRGIWGGVMLEGARQASDGKGL